MFIIFPTSTDVPIYHWPFATGGMILVNVVIFIFEKVFPEFVGFFVLSYGQFNPITWFTSACMHGSVIHLIGNMLGIALFGWIIEGKVGWWRFLLIYFGIAGFSGYVIQMVMLFAVSGGALGASCVVFGLIAMAMLWSPENEINLVVGALLLFRPIVWTFAISVSTLGFVMISIEFLMAALSSFAMSSALFHLFGVVPGFLIGYMMLRYRRVDCEGYDMISILRGKRGQVTPTVEQEKKRAAHVEQVKKESQENLETGLTMVARYIDEGHYDLALNRFSMIRRTNRDLVMTESQLITIIKAFDQHDTSKPKTVPLIQSYLEHYNRLTIPLTLMMARVLILLQERPRQGLKALKSLRWNDLDADQKSFSRKLIERAQAMIADGVMEVED